MPLRVCCSLRMSLHPWYMWPFKGIIHRLQHKLLLKLDLDFLEWYPSARGCRCYFNLLKSGRNSFMLSLFLSKRWPVAPWLVTSFSFWLAQACSIMLFLAPSPALNACLPMKIHPIHLVTVSLLQIQKQLHTPASLQWLCSPDFWKCNLNRSNEAHLQMTVRSMLHRKK